MKYYFAGMYGLPKKIQQMVTAKPPLYVLESFFYFQPWEEIFITKCKGFLLDSGTFTFLNSYKSSVDFTEYLIRYIDFIRRYEISNFIELDIDSVIGRNKTEDLRKRLEDKVGARCIPCWHKSRGVQEWCKLTEKYSRVAIGGIVTKEITKKEYKWLPSLLRVARKNGCKVHIMGGSAQPFQHMDIDSFDSTTPLKCTAFGYVVRFTGKSLKKIPQNPERRWLDHSLRAYNLIEHLKYQYYLDGEKYEEDYSKFIDV